MNEKCRICLENSSQIMENLFDNAILLQKLLECTSIQIDNNESLPKRICELCKSKLILAHHFKELCLKSENELKLLDASNLNNVFSQSTENSQEILTELLKRTDQFKDQEIILIIEEPSSEKENAKQDSKEITSESQEKVQDLEIETKLSTSQNQESPVRTTRLKKKLEESPIDEFEENNLELQNIKSIRVVEDGKVKYKKKCPKCGILQQNLKQHYMIHTQVKKFTCKYCNKQFSQIGNYKTHLNIHTGIKPYQCQICSNSFTDPNSLKAHMVRHTGERKYKCQICGKSFGYAHTLTVHKLSHSQIRNFECFHCGKCFLTKYSIKKHMRVHSGEKPYKCKLCPKSFPTSGNLSTHQLVHSKIKKFACELCSFKCSYKCVLNVHIKKTHNKGKL